MAQHLPPDFPPAPSADCTVVRTHLDAFVDGELTSFDAHDRPFSQVVEGHLQECARCAHVARELGALRAAVRAVGAREQATVRTSDALRRRVDEILSSR